MLAAPRVRFWLAPLAVAGFVWVAAPGQSPPAGNPPEAARKPPSVEDELRELKRRADAADRERKELLTKIGQLQTQLGEAKLSLEEDAKAREKAIAEATKEQAALDRVPVGAMIPYFGTGDSPPKGYVFADGTRAWPHADWVPKHLREDSAGQPHDVAVPNMHRELLGGTTDEGEVGSVWKKGKLCFTVPGTAFTVPAGKDASKVANKDMIQWIRGSEPLKALKTTGRYDAQVNIVNVLSSYLEYSGSLGGSHPVEIGLDDTKYNPRHVMCRWIIRVE